MEVLLLSILFLTIALGDEIFNGNLKISQRLLTKLDRQKARKRSFLNK
ncbi:MAG: hypothetical protein ACLFV6_12850 [Spirulinaceae cyanobacterium]